MTDAETINQLRAERDEIENRTDEQWLDAIAANSKIAFGKEWETRDGESPQEGRQANISAIFSEIETLRAERDECHAQFKRIYEMLPPKQGGYSGKECVDEYLKLRVHNAALLAVASRVSEWLKERDEKGYTLRDAFEAPAIQALSALEPLGIEV